jgi:hypothetical protein
MQGSSLWKERGTRSSFEDALEVDVRESYSFPKVQVIPEVGRASFQVDGVERLTYHFGQGASRPFLFPLVGPSGATLTRMGHPNPGGHEHHKSVWFGHESIDGVNFWEEPVNSDVRIRHQSVELYHDADDFGGLVARLVWWARGRAVLRQELTVAVEPFASGEFALDLQSRFEALDRPVEFGRTNFGFLGVRVAKTLSEQFGGGSLRNEHGARGEAALFGKTSRWVDYSGPSKPGTVEGICYMDHPDNPNHPTAWHVRRDGWMGAAFNLGSTYGVAAGHPLDLRYRLFVHRGMPTSADLQSAWERFAQSLPFTVARGTGSGLPTLRRGTRPPEQVSVRG